MTHWCPVCESPGLPVARGPRSNGEQNGVVSVSRDLPGIEPSHFCSRCPTWFRSRDRFYLTAVHDRGVHGIAVWPHGDRRISVEIGEEGLVCTFDDGASALISRGDTSGIATSFFRRFTEWEIWSWASRRGFRLRIVPAGDGTADLVVDRVGPHFVLLVTKSWFRANHIRDSEDGVACLEAEGVSPVLFQPIGAGEG